MTARSEREGEKPHCWYVSRGVARIGGLSRRPRNASDTSSHRQLVAVRFFVVIGVMRRVDSQRFVESRLTVEN